MNRAVKITPGARLLFIGDSVTDCDRLRPVGRGSRFALGTGYVAEVDAMLEPFQKGRPIQITNMGTSGNTVRDLAQRWDTDVLALEPDWLSVMIGMNDVRKQFDGVDPASSVRLDEFWDTYGGLVARTRPLLKGLVLMTPYYVQSDRGDPIRMMMDEYGRVVKDLAARYGVLLVDTQRSPWTACLRGQTTRRSPPTGCIPRKWATRIPGVRIMRAVGITPRRRR